MADTAKRLAGPAQLTATAATQYTCPALTTTIIRHIHVHNPAANASQYNFTLSIGADAAGTRIWDALTIPIGGSLDWTGFMVLTAAEIVQAFASTASKLSIVINGIEVT